MLARQADRVVGKVRKVSHRHLAERFRTFSRRALHTYDRSASEAVVHGVEAQMLMLSLLAEQAASSRSAHPSVTVFRRADQFMVDHIVADLSILDVATQVGVSRRAMELAFERCAGISPAKFWKILRLNQVRRLLESGHCGVAEAASVSGLGHLGRLSAEYRALFDELPSVTATRSIGG